MTAPRIPRHREPVIPASDLGWYELTPMSVARIALYLIVVGVVMILAECGQ